MPFAARTVARWVLVGLTCALLAAPATRVSAQPMRKVVLVPLAFERSVLVDRAAGQLEAELARRSILLVSMHEAHDRFTARIRDPQQPSESDLEALVRAAHDASEHVAFGRTSAARRSVHEVISRAERTLESLNRETAIAQQVLDACLSLVRSALQTEARDTAVHQAMDCRRLVPDLAPSEAAHPVNVIGVLAEADDLLRRMQLGRLSVESTPKNHCSVYVNGRHLGTTPFELDRAAAGPYRVQVECERSPARVHLVQLGDEPVRLVVDTEFERAIVSEPRLALRYPTREASAKIAGHASELGRMVGADDVLLVATERERAELLRVRVQQRRIVARASLRWTESRGFAEAELVAALGTLAEGRLPDEDSWVQGNGAAPIEVREATPHSSPSMSPAEGVGQPSSASETPNLERLPTERQDWPSRRTSGRNRKAWQIGLGATALAFGTGSFVAAAVLSAKRAEAGTALLAANLESMEYRVRLSSWEDQRVPPYVFGALGAVALTSAAFGLLLGEPGSDFPVWPTVLSGLLGGGFMAWGAIDLAKGGSCGPEHVDRRSCSRAQERMDRGALAMLAALPLLSVPIVRAIGHAERRNDLNIGFALWPETHRATLVLVARMPQR